MGLYAAGLFWNIPRDLLGAFSFSEFLFKSSVIYVSIFGGGLAVLFAATSIYGLITPETESDALSKPNQSEPAAWPSLSLSQRIKVSIAGLAIIGLAAFAYYVDPFPIRGDPAGWAAILSVSFVLILPFRPFLSDMKWRAASILYFLTWVIVAPFAMGFSDSQPDALSPKLRIEGAVCVLVVLGTQNALFACPDTYSLVPTDKLKVPLNWHAAKK